MSAKPMLIPVSLVTVGRSVNVSNSAQVQGASNSLQVQAEHCIVPRQLQQAGSVLLEPWCRSFQHAPHHFHLADPTRCYPLQGVSKSLVLVLPHCNHLARCDPGPAMSLAGIPHLEPGHLQPTVLNCIVTRFPERQWLWVDEAVAVTSCVRWLVDTMHFGMEKTAHRSDFCENEPLWDPRDVQASLMPYTGLIGKGTLCAASLRKHGF